MNMEEKLFNPGRRAVLAKILAGGALGITGMSGIIRHALAVGGETYPQGIREIRGEVRINGVSAQAGASVKAGDVITTGADSSAIIVTDMSAYLIRENSRLVLESTQSPGETKAQIMNTLKVLGGKMLAVFGRGKKRIITPTAVIGIRGTGAYVERLRRNAHISAPVTARLISNAKPIP